MPAPAPAYTPAATAARILTSPLVKRMAREEDVDLRYVAGTGAGGRVTRRDILHFIEERKAGRVAVPAPGYVAMRCPRRRPRCRRRWRRDGGPGDRRSCPRGQPAWRPRSSPATASSR